MSLLGEGVVTLQGGGSGVSTEQLTTPCGGGGDGVVPCFSVRNLWMGLRYFFCLHCPI